MKTRIGMGWDLHRLQAGSGLPLGGVTVDCDFSPVAHSDGDVLLHAITDAILGALSQPDIGELFPDSAACNAGRDSGDFLTEALRRMNASNYELGNLDATLILQQPKLAPHKDAIRTRLSELLGCEQLDVNIKAKTNEGVDALGRGEAIAAMVVVLLFERAAEVA